MSLLTPYATPEDYTAAGKGAVDARLKDDLVAISRYIDDQLHPGYGGGFFAKDDSAQVRIYYPPRAGRTLSVDPIATTTSLAIKMDNNMDGSFTETAWAAADYQLLPLNAAAGPEVNPWDEIYIPLWSSQPVFVPQIAVQVTAFWGWPSVPAAIKTACIELTAILRVQSPYATNTYSVDIGRVLGVSPIARSILAELMSVYRGRMVF